MQRGKVRVHLRVLRSVEAMTANPPNDPKGQIWPQQPPAAATYAKSLGGNSLGEGKIPLCRDRHRPRALQRRRVGRIPAVGG